MTVRWLGNSDIIRQIQATWPDAPAPTWALGPPHSAPLSDTTTPIANYKSFDRFCDDVRTDGISIRYRWVMYDPESWDWTPPAEQADPWAWLPRFGQYAHAHGYRVITAPARDLGNVKDSVHPKQPGEDLSEWYIDADLPGTAALCSDIVSVQSQALTGDVVGYGTFVDTASRYAKAENPYVKILAGVSTRYGTPAQMAAAARSVHVDGYWLNVPDGDVGKACEFLQLMTGGGA